MNFGGATPFPTKRFNGQVDWDDPTQIPNGCAIKAQACRFQAESVATRYGLRHALQYANASGDPSGMEVLDVEAKGGTDLSIVYTSDGQLLIENPAGSGTLAPVVTPTVLPSGKVVCQISKAYQRAYMAFSNLQTPQGPPLMLDGPTVQVLSASQNPVGMTWTPGTYAMVGDMVRASATSPQYGKWFRCLTPGLMGPTEPNWPGQIGYFAATGGFVEPSVQDPNGPSIWGEWTPAIATNFPRPDVSEATLSVGSGGSIPAGKDVYLQLAYNYNSTGESPNKSDTLVAQNTGANSTITISWNSGDASGTARGPAMPTWVAQLALDPNPPQGFGTPGLTIDVYFAAVTAGSGAPAQSAYQFWGTVPVNNKIVITNLNVGTYNAPLNVQVPGTISGHLFYGATGRRWAIFTREALDGTLAPVDPNSPISFFAQGSSSNFVITAIERDASGFIYLTTPDISQFYVGQTVTTSQVFNSTTGQEDATFEGTWAITNIILSPNLPQGILQIQTATMTTLATTPATGYISLAQGAAPVAVFPVGAFQGIVSNIVGLTVVGESNAGPYFFIPEDDPATIYSSAVRVLSRANGTGYATVNDGSGFSPGQIIGITGAGSLNTEQVIASVNGNNIVFPFPGATTTLQPLRVGLIQMATLQELATSNASGTPYASGLNATLNYTDTYLTGSEEITYLLTAMTIPPCVDLYFTPSLRRLAVAGAVGFETGFLFTEQDEVGTIDGATGFLPIESSNGGRAVCVREMPNQMVIGLKSNGGYRIEASATGPSDWGIARLWDTYGPPDARCVAVGRDYIIFGCQEGFYRYDAGPNPECVSREIAQSWQRINWQASQPMWICIDEEEKVVHVGVATNGSDTPNEEWQLNYFMGWEPPVRETLTGDMMVARNARRWSIGDKGIQARQAIIAKRTMSYDPNGGAMPDERIATRQLLYGITQSISTADVSVVQTLVSPSPITSPPAVDVFPFQTYVRVAKVMNGQEVAVTPLLGPFETTETDVPVGDFIWHTFQVNLPGNLPANVSWNVHYGNDPSGLTWVINVPGSATSLVFTQDGSATAPYTGTNFTAYIDMPYPDVFDDNGQGIDWQYQPAFAQAMGRILRFRGVQGQAKGYGTLMLTPVSDDPLGLASTPVNLGLNGDTIHFARGIILDREHLGYNVNNGAQPGVWAQLHELVVWFVPLFASRRVAK